MSTAVAGVNSSSSASTEVLPPTTNASSQLTQADFLKIMVAQFTTQDPLSSGDGSSNNGTSDYVNQLMSMTNLTTQQTISKQQAQMLATSLPGQTVVVKDGSGNTANGVVQSARVDSADLGVYFTVGGTEYPSTDLYSISQTPAAASTATTPSTSN